MPFRKCIECERECIGEKPCMNCKNVTYLIPFVVAIIMLGIFLLAAFFAATSN